MIIFLFGKEKYLIHQRLTELKSVFSAKYPEAIIKEKDLEEEYDLEEIAMSLRDGGGLFTDKKMIILKNSLSLKAIVQEKFKEYLKEFKKHKNLETILIIAETHSKETKGKLINYLKRVDQVKEYKPLSGQEVNKWIKEMFKRISRGMVNIEPSAINHLNEITQGDCWKIESEIKKLVNYKVEGEISLAEVNQLCLGETEAKIFDLVDAIGANNKEEALKLKAKLIRQGQNEFYIFTMILFQIKNLIKVLECVKKGINQPKAISQKLKIHPFVVQKTYNQLRKFSLGKVKKIYKLAAELDLKTKTGEYDMKEMLDYLIVKI